MAARCAELGAAGVHVLQTDMGAPEAASAMPAAAIAESGGHDIDVLILNHAAFAESLTLELESESDMQRHVVTPMRVNYEGTVRAAVAALPSLSKTAGRLVVVSSGEAGQTRGLGCAKPECQPHATGFVETLACTVPCPASCDGSGAPSSTLPALSRPLTPPLCFAPKRVCCLRLGRSLGKGAGILHGRIRRV